MINLLKSKLMLGVMVLAFVIAGGALVADAAYMHTVTLKQGSSGPQVVALQQALGISADGAFGPMTKAAVMSFQTSKGLTADGIVGPMTGAAIGGSMTGNFPAGCTSAAGYSTTTGLPCNSGPSTGLPAGCSSTAGYSPLTGKKCDSSTTPTTGGPLSGTVGTIDYALTSGYSNEEVGEADEDVKVAGLELDLEDSDSDVRITAVKLNFDVGTAGNDFEDYADEVSVWLGNEEVARVDGDSFNDDNDFEKTVSLSGAIVRMGDVEDLYVAVSGVSNLDTADIGDTWTVDFASVRFEDAEGVVTTEDPTEAAVTFSFESFATSTDVELKVSEADEDINDAHVINVHATDDTDDVAILSFNLEAEGDSDLLIDALPVTITTVEATGNDPDDLISTYYLYAGDDEIGTESNPSTDVTDDSSTVVVFDDLDYTLDAGDEVEFTVKVKLYSIADTLDAGDTVAAAFGETETDLATFEVEDESGEELADGDKTGTVTGEAHSLRDVGMMADFVSASAVATPSGVATVDDTGTFKIIFDVTAFDSDIYIDGTAIADETGGIAPGYQDIDASTTSVGAGVIECSTCTTAANTTFKVPEGQTKRFTVTIAGSGADVFASASLTSILYATTAIAGDTLYTFDMADFKTDSVWLDSN